MHCRISFGRFFLKYLLLLSITGCYKDHLYVQQQWIDETYLASSRIPGAPDPRKEHPPKGQRLLIGWVFPNSLFMQELCLHITVRFWNQTETTFTRPVQSKRGHAAIFFPFEDKQYRILTYQIRVFSNTGELIETWNHQFWTRLIEIGEPLDTLLKSSCEFNTSSSVSSQPKQGSVIETP